MVGTIDGEAELVEQARGDRRAFAPLYGRYFDPVYRYCFRRLGDADAAADAASLVFTKALAALPASSEAPGAFRRWLFTIAHNVIADGFRSARSDRPLDAVAELVDAGPSPEELAVAAEEERALLTLLAQLPADQRRVLELRLAGLTGAEIAQALDRSHAAVKMLQARAVARLRQLRLAEMDARERDDDG